MTSDRFMDEIRGLIPNIVQPYDKDYLQSAYAAARLSPNPNTQVGVASRSKCRIQGVWVAMTDCNRPPDAVRINPETYVTSRDYRTSMEIHAEQMLIARSARLGVSLAGGTLCAPWTVCPECAKAVIAAGFQAVVGHTELLALTHEPWRDRILEGVRLLVQSGVEVRRYDGPLGESLRMGGDTVHV